MVEERARGRGLAIVLIVVIVAGGWYYWYRRQPPPPVILQDSYPSQYAEQAGTPLAFTNSIGMSFTLIPPGTFTMGSPKNEGGRTVYEYPHEMAVTNPFYMAVTEVTQAQYEMIMGTNPSHFTDSPSRPVDQPTWFDALEFCNRLSRMEELEPVYEFKEDKWLCHIGRDGYRLPVETEWEYACRAGTTTAFFSGPNHPFKVGRANLRAVAIYMGNSGGETHPVRSRKPNQWGLYDMLGNVHEWCWDNYAPYLVNATPFMGPDQNIAGRTIRGGAWYERDDRCRCASRRSWLPADRWNMVGFRCARSVVPAR